MAKNSQKRALGQFYTTNYEYILQGFSIPEGPSIIEPFAGRGDLFDFIYKHRSNAQIEAYDIQPIHREKSQATIERRDVFLDPPDYTDKFVITNPPYLARNKAYDQTYHDKYKVNDLYKCFIKQLTESLAAGGIVIIPLNFWSSVRTADVKMRRDFLKAYSVPRLNIFEERVFDDTSYAICSFQFARNTEARVYNDIEAIVYPRAHIMKARLTADNLYTFGGEIYGLPSSPEYTLARLTRETPANLAHTNLVVRCLDSNAANQINMSYVDDNKVFVDETPKLSARSFMTLVIQPELSEARQRELARAFNAFLSEWRNKYNSLFLANYRESNTCARKRISFDLVYKIVAHLLI